MKKLYNIGMSKELTSDRISKLAYNLREISERSVKIEISQWAHGHRNKVSPIEYMIFFVPGIDSEPYTQKYFSSWPEVIEFYFKFKVELKK